MLVVDDEASLRTIISDELVHHGYEVQVAENGTDALGILENNRHQLVILDIRMPGMDGLEVLRLIREKNLADKVIMLTGVDELKMARTSLELGANDFMTKPFLFQNLLACIERVLKGK